MPIGSIGDCAPERAFGGRISLALMLAASAEVGTPGRSQGRRRQGPSLTLCPLQEAWKHAIQKAKHMPDPWAEFHLEDIATECATRHRSAACLEVLYGVPGGMGPASAHSL